MAVLGPRLLLVLVPLLVLLLVLGVVVVAVLGDRGRPRPPRTPVREGRLVGLTRVVGVVVGFLASQAVAQGGTSGTGPMLSPTVFGTCVLLAVVVGETLVRPRSGPGVRSASLGMRRVRDYAPRTWIPVAVVVLMTAALLLLTTLTASLDSPGGEARAVSCTRGVFSSTASPYPGAYYSGPLALGLLGVLAVAGLAARQVVLRPRGRGDVGGDDALRRRSLRVVVAATGVAVGLSYVGVATTAATALHTLGAQIGDCAPGWAGPLAATLVVTVLLVMALVLGCVLVLLRPGTPHGPHVPATTPDHTPPAPWDDATSGRPAR